MILTSSMAWTQDEADQVRAAILALATGKRVVTVQYAGPPARQVQYHQTDLAELRKLLAEMETATAGSSSGRRFRRVAFSKGFKGGDE